ALLISFSFCTVSGQGTPLYLKQKTPPPAVLLLTDSTTRWQLKANLQKGKPLFLLFFSPDCDHCQHETESLVKNIEKFKGIQIVMATTQPFPAMKEFAARY